VSNDEQVKRDALRELSEADRAYRSVYKRLTSRRLTKTPQRLFADLAGAANRLRAATSRLHRHSRERSAAFAEWESQVTKEEDAISRTIQEVMTPNPTTVEAGVTLMEAARAMRKHGVGDVIVTDDKGQIWGILTDRDIAVRAVAEGLDPTAVTVREICSREISALEPMNTVADAVRLMREKAVRRLPVVEGRQAVGVVSLGDLALEHDMTSTLVHIRAAPPNT
jgi:CBS domain-containing protein